MVKVKTQLQHGVIWYETRRYGTRDGDPGCLGSLVGTKKSILGVEIVGRNARGVVE